MPHSLEERHDILKYRYYFDPWVFVSSGLAVAMGIGVIVMAGELLPSGITASFGRVILTCGRVMLYIFGIACIVTGLSGPITCELAVCWTFDNQAGKVNRELRRVFGRRMTEWPIDEFVAVEVDNKYVPDDGGEYYEFRIVMVTRVGTRVPLTNGSLVTEKEAEPPDTILAMAATIRNYLAG